MSYKPYHRRFSEKWYTGLFDTVKKVNLVMPEKFNYKWNDEYVRYRDILFTVTKAREEFAKINPPIEVDEDTEKELDILYNGQNNISSDLIIEAYTKVLNRKNDEYAYIDEQLKKIGVERNYHSFSNL